MVQCIKAEGTFEGENSQQQQGFPACPLLWVPVAVATLGRPEKYESSLPRGLRNKAHSSLDYGISYSHNKMNDAISH